MNYRYLFGPVPSRRLGLSLGVDLLVPKTCTLNCIYCECADTTNLTLNRKQYVQTSEVISELNMFLVNKPQLDYITFSGSGEPTLHTGLKDIINYLKTHYASYKLCLITNSTLLWQEEVICAVKDIDLIIPSLDAVSDEIFNKINRPHVNLNSKLVIEGLINLRKNFKNAIWLELFIVPDINNTLEELKLIKNTIDKINPDKVHINFLDRPCLDSFVRKPTEQEIDIIKEIIPESEVIGKFSIEKNTILKSNSDSVDDLKDSVIKYLKRRPGTKEDLMISLKIEPDILEQILHNLSVQKEISSRKGERGEFFFYSKKLN